MSKIVKLETAQKVGLNFLESVKPSKGDILRGELKNAVKTTPRKLELVHQATTLKRFTKKSKLRKDTKDFQLDKTDEPCFYIFNSNDDGFVIVSADEGTNPILGYSTDGKIDETNLPPSMVLYLEGLRKNVLKTRTEDLQVNNDIISKWTKLKRNNQDKNQRSEKNSDSDSDSDNDDTPRSVSPLIQTKWGQQAPYNKFCPKEGVTGCVATAMAQVMKYHNWPRRGTGSYKSSGITANFGSTIYQWESMPNKLTSSSPTHQINAVATLMLHCGISLDMHYGPKSSGASTTNVRKSLIKYFKYNPKMKIYKEPNKSENNEWRRMLRLELNSGRPVVYRGRRKDSGHAFICDGYDNNELFHFNWGWNGSSDGYFSITDLNGFDYSNFFIYLIKDYLTEDITSFDYNKTTIERINNRYKIVQGKMWMLDFGSDSASATKTLKIIKHYKMNQQCFVGRPKPVMKYFLCNGKAPVGSFPGEDAIGFNPSTIEIKRIKNRWKLVDINHWIMDFGSNKANALKSLDIIHKYGFNKICFVGRPNPNMLYFRR